MESMELYLIEDYKDSFPQLRGKALTDALIVQVLTENRYLPEDAQPVIQRLDGGKPVLQDNDRIRFSVSHTAELFACVVSAAEEQEETAPEMGLDIQYVRSTDTDRLARRYFTEDEVQYLQQQDRDAFFRLWTRKEALSKYTGRGMAQILEKEPVLAREDVIFTDLVLGDGLYGCICTGI